MGLFGNLFDWNGDGIATPGEEMAGLMLLEQMERARAAEEAALREEEDKTEEEEEDVED